ncbi:hypothetical protein [Legionella spiritensis]|uniref:NHL repeat protein n=1 Tax=Legionella spiritensis TaxID=452 RepID=A0A0W0YYW4_LEGSP|nr:hypothetical protein [Legionella spiritensis]KTD61839.1 NHL repeat protein [Legionella spiritensis]SNV31609.1 NHL repeat protein [Legionella spiritensis]
MKRNLLIILSCCSGLYLSASLSAATSVFSITPVVLPPAVVVSGQTATAVYQVKNNTPFPLNNNGVIQLPNGVQQITSGGAGICQSPFNLGAQESCTLQFEINADNMTGSIKGGPTICNTINHPVYCATPAQQWDIEKRTIEPQTIIFMRHAEKPLPPASGKGQLTCQGLNRALALPQVLNNKFGKPDYIFAPNTAGSIGDGGDAPYSYVRPLATIEPTAIQYGMPVDTALNFDDDDSLAAELISSPYHTSRIFVAWEHNNIVAITRKIMTLLGANPNVIPTWAQNDFDSLYVLTIVWYDGNAAVSFSHQYENLSSGLSTTCPGSAPLAFKKSREKPPAADRNIANETEIIYFIPAAEPQASAQLSCQGLNRALGLINTLDAAALGDSIYAFFAPAPALNRFVMGSQLYDYLSGMMTLEPAAIAQDHPLYTLFGYEDNLSMATFLLSSQFFADRTLAVAWEPGQLPDLAKRVYEAAGGNPNDIPSPIPNVDTMYKITITRNDGTLVSVNYDAVQENLSPSNVCPLPIS